MLFFVLIFVVKSFDLVDCHRHDRAYYDPEFTYHNVYSGEDQYSIGRGTIKLTFNYPNPNLPTIKLTYN
jgi:hypothetical protein